MARLDNLDYEVNGVTTNYEIVPEIAPLFNATTAYAAGDQVIHEGIRWKFTTAHPAGAWIGTDVEEMPTVAEELTSHGADITELKADFTQLDETAARIDGSYDTMTVGNAKQLTSNVGINDKAPYLFRTAGGANDIGDREEDAIVGGSVVWNQLVQNGNFDSTTNWKATGGSITVSDNVCTFTISGTVTDLGIRLDTEAYIQRISGHKYLSLMDVKLPKSTTTARLYPVGNKYKASISIPANTWTTVFAIVSEDTNSSSGKTQFFLGYSVGDGYEAGDTFQIRRVNTFDLTTAFPTAVADYVYALEQATAGSGIAWLRKYGFFTKDYYPYSEPTFKNVGGLASHKMTGFNQWDEVWEIGGINASSGENESRANRIRSKNYIPVVPSAQYYANFTDTGFSFYVRLYDADKNFIGAIPYFSHPSIITMPDNAYYLRFFVYKSGWSSGYGTDLLININLHWDGERDGEYEAYKVNTYPLDDSLTLRGIPKLDANNDLYYDGDRYLPDGTVERNYILIDLGTVNFDYYSSGGYFRSAVYSAAKAGANNVVGNLLCSAYVATAPNALNDKTINIATNGRIVIRDDSFNGDATAFNASLSGVYLLAEAATTTTETADPFQTPQVVDDWGTEEYVYTDGAFPIPVGHDTFYAANLKAKLEMAPDSPGDGDGDYIVRQTNGLNEYAKLVIPAELPTSPSEDGTYTLKATVADGTVTLAWVADT